MYRKIFSRQKNREKIDWDTFVIIVPIKIRSIRYIEEVIVKKCLIDKVYIYIKQKQKKTGRNLQAPH